MGNFETGEKPRRPFEPGLIEEARSKIGAAVLGKDARDALLAIGIGGAAQRERHGSEAELEQPVAARRLEIILALRRRARDQFDLPGVEPEARIGHLALRLDRAVVGKQYALRAAFDDLDGDDPAQIAWALKQDANAKLILVKGAPLELMKARQRRFYFDQSGKLTQKFGIKAVPARVRQNGRFLEVSEIALPRRKAQP